jgi:hydroxypyruvate isomerase
MQPSRRDWLALSTGLVTAAAMNAQVRSQQPAGPEKALEPLRQSVMGWCFKPMPELELAQLGKQLGLVAIEGIGAEFYPAVKELGLEVSLVGSHGFSQGPVDASHHMAVEESLRKGIETAVRVGSPSVITFTGMRVPGMRDELAMQNCLDCWKRVIEDAERAGVTLCLEHLNSRDDSHPMKGHPGYFGDDVELCMDLVRKMDSPNFKLLFDIYHVQVMHGDVIRRIRSYHPWIGHYHTAGNPGRGEIDEHQEINYPPIFQAIRETGYRGFIAHEFIPTWQDAARSLEHAIKLSS